jgi:hypothetical protein
MRAGRGGVRVAFLLCLIVCVCLSLVVSVASASGAVAWKVQSVPEPSVFSAGDAFSCAQAGHLKCDRYQVLVMNSGNEESSAPITLTVTLPTGITTLETPESGQDDEGVEWGCTPTGAGNASLTCTFTDPVPGGHFAPHLDIPVTAPSASLSGSLEATMSVEGNGATASTHVVTPVNAPAPVFDADEFAFEPDGADGAPLTQAGGHPWELTTSLGIPAVLSPQGEAGRPYAAVENIKTVAVELPMGVVADAQALEKCTETELKENRCPPESQVGVFDVIGGALEHGEFVYSEAPASGFCCSKVYNMVPEHGYPAQFGFTFATVPLEVYPNVVRTVAGYRVRGVVPGIPAELEVKDSALVFYGEPGQLNGSGSEAAFLTSPEVCAAEASADRTSRIELNSWEDPGRVSERESVAYPELTGCDLLQFNNPSLSFEPSLAGEGGTTQADQPSGYTANLEVPQTSAFSELATPEIENLTATAPAGVSLDPSVATGLVGCQETGPEGINLGSGQVEPDGQDIGDPEATELGAGHAGGNDSPYDDGQYHTAPGHCPAHSVIGTLEVSTPLLASPLTGHVYVAQPKCGGASQPACTEAEAADGELYEGYAELEGSGVIIKQRGAIATNPTTGQLTLTIKQIPQFPFSDLKLHLNGGEKAPLANPQECGTATTTSTLEPWSAPASANASLASHFSVDWDGHGGACPGSLPLSPAFTAGTITPVADGSSPLTLTLTRHDREQDLSGLTVNTPPGLLGTISSVTQCGEPQAAQGTCSPASQIGVDHVTVGAGSEPFFVEGKVYLTGPYKGAPFGLSIVNPAVAGPFNLGDVVVQAAIHINPRTDAITTVSDPLPQIKDGIPLRVQTINVLLNRPGFIVNPTNCGQQKITATVTGTQGASASVESPFAVTGCPSLPFKPTYTESTEGVTSKVGGASLTVNVTQKTGEANIQKVDVQIPKQLPSRLTTLQKACLEAQFNANPAGCPEASDVGTATAVTPLLNVPLTGPAYLVARGTEFPDLEFVLQGEGVTIILDGQTDIKKGITYSNFETVPDAPISSFQATFPESPHSILAANVNLCDPTETITVKKRVKRRIHGHIRHVTIKVKKTIPIHLTSPTTITGQNGTVIKQTTSIAVTKCPKAKPPAKPTKHSKPKKKK